jgi:hypothetical protein
MAQLRATAHDDAPPWCSMVCTPVYTVDYIAKIIKVSNPFHYFNMLICRSMYVKCTCKVIIKVPNALLSPAGCSI